MAALPEPEQKMIGDYIVDRTLGEGTFGKVRLGIHIVTRQKVALKIIRVRTEAEERDLKYIGREIKIMKFLCHENIVQLLDVIEMPEKRSTCLVLEYVSGGELFDFIVANGRLKEKEAIRFFRQIVSAMEYMHSNLVVHRDLKPENLLLDKNKNIKINDFGLSNFVPLGSFLDSHCGSPHYSPPEIIQEKPYVGPEVDMWALGVLLYAMITGCLPWSGDNIKQQIDNVVVGRYKVPKYVSEECANLIGRMLTVDRKERATIQEVVNHPWLRQGYNDPPPTTRLRRDSISLPLNAEWMKTLKDLGFDSDNIESDLKTNDITKQHVMIYHLLSEAHERRLRAEIERKAQEEKALIIPPSLGKNSPRNSQSDSDGSLYASTNSEGRDDDFSDDLPLSVRDRTNRHSWCPPVKNDLNPDDPGSPTKGHRPSTGSPIPARLISINKWLKKSLRTSLEGKSMQDAIDKAHPERSLRTIDGTFNSKTSTLKDVAEIRDEVERVLNEAQVAYKINKKRTVFECKDKNVEVKFTIEICKIKKMPDMKGLRFNRTKGNVFEFKEVYSRICDRMAL